MSLDARVGDVDGRFGGPHAPEVDALWAGKISGESLRAELPGSSGSRRGRILRLLGDATAARKAFESARRASPSDVEARLGLAELGLEKPAASALLDGVAGPDASFLRGAALFLRGKAAAAVFELEAAVSAAPGSLAAPYLLGLAREAAGGDAAAAFREASARGFWAAPCLKLGDLDGALDRAPDYALVAASTFRPGDSVEDRLREVGRLALSNPERFAAFDGLRGLFKPQPARAQIEACRALAQARPDRAWSWALLGRALLRDGRDPGGAREGLAALDRAAAACPAAGWVLSWRAQAHIALGALDAALADFDACVRLQPFYHRAYAWRGALLARMGRHEAAVADLGVSVDCDPDYHFAWRQRALARRAAGDAAGAARDLSRAYRLKPKYEWNPKDSGGGAPPADADGDLAELDAAAKASPDEPAVLAWRARARLRAGDAKGGRAGLEAALKKDPSFALARAWLGRALIEAGEAEEGRAHLRRAVKDDPTFWTLRAWSARAEFDGGKKAAAVASLRALAKARPAPWALALLSELEGLRGRWKEAAAAADAATELDGQHGHAYLLAARARRELGDAPGALAALEKAEELLPLSPQAAELRASLAAPGRSAYTEG